MVDLDKKEGEERSKALLQAYRNRLDYVKQAWMYESKGELGNAILAYEKYLEVLARFHKCEKDTLRPQLFKKIDKDGEENKNEDDVHEIFLLSQVVWNMAKIYSRSDKENHILKTRDMLAKFIDFSTGYKFQFLNSETCRKYLKNVKGQTADDFETTFQKLKVSSKSCYIATWCYTQQHSDLDIFRSARDSLYPFSFFKKLIHKYYKYSPKVVSFLDSHNLIGQVVRSIFRPMLGCLAKILRPFII